MAMLLLSQAQYRHLRLDDVAVDAALHAAAEVAQWEAALLLLANMEAIAVPPGQISFNTCIEACAEDQWERSLHLLSQMRSTPRVRPDQITYTSFFNALVLREQWKEALQALDDMQEDAVPPTARDYAAAMSCCRRSAPEVAKALLQRMLNSSVELHSFAYPALIAAARSAHEAIELASDLFSRRLEPDIVIETALLARCARDGINKEVVRREATLGGFAAQLLRGLHRT
ncbi:unnamed protein product [Symbiodinium sp. KB8]|nr:unnamed protein product [Symbiodinium sp. KB8]